jgi:hypothetical protein
VYQDQPDGPPDRDMLTAPDNARSLDRRRVYVGEGLSFQIES